MQIAVIGRGIAGLTISYRLSERGYKPTLFGKNELRASDAAQGLLCNKGLLFAYQPLFKAKLKSLQRVQRFLSEVEKNSGLSIEKRFDGVMEPYFSDEDYHRIVKRVYKGQFTGIYGAKNLPPSPSLKNIFDRPEGCLFYPRDGWYSARDLLLALESYLAKLGVKSNQDLVASIRPLSDGRIAIKTKSGETGIFDKLVIAAGVGTQKLIEGLVVSGIRFFYHPGQVMAIDHDGLDGNAFVRRTFSMIGRKKIMLGSTTGKSLVPNFDVDLQAGREKLWDALSEEFYLKPEFIKALRSRAIEDLWGVRVRIHDRQPILGSLGAFDSALHSVFVCAGLYKNGLQLSEVMAKWLVEEMLDGRIDEIGKSFHVSRFTKC